MSKLKSNDGLVLAGGIIVLAFGLVRWFSWKVRVDGRVFLSEKSNAFDYFFTGVVPWMLIVGAALLTLLLVTGQLVEGKLPWPLIILAATLLGFILIIIRLITGHDADTQDVEGASVDVSRGIGLWISSLGALVATAGAFVGFRNYGLETEYKPVGGGPLPDREIPPTSS